MSDDDALDELMRQAPGSVSACDRCGNYAELQDVGARALCDECRTRRSLRIDENPPNGRNLVVDTFRVIRHLHWRLLFVVFLFQLPIAIVNAFVELPPAVWYASTVVTVAADMAILHMTASLLEGAEPSLPTALAAAARRWPLLVVVQVLSTLAILVGFVLCIIPGFYVALALTAAIPIAMAEHLGPIEAMKASHRRTKGALWAIFGGNLAFGLGARFADGVCDAVMAIVWDLPLWAELSEPTWTILSVLVSVVFTTFVYTLGYIPARVLPIVLYFQTLGRDTHPT